MIMNVARNRAGFFLLLLMALALPEFTACESRHSTINITLESDYSQIIQAINNANNSLTGKLELIETDVTDGDARKELIQQAVESLSGTMEEKLEAIEEAVNSQTTSLSGKLTLIETAVKQGLADKKKALNLVKGAVESIPSAIAELDSDLGGKIDDVVTSLGGLEAAVSTDIASALTDIFCAIDGLADYTDILTAIQEAVAQIELPHSSSDELPHGSPDDLTIWCYPNATFDLDLSKALQISEIFCALDKSKDGSYTAEDIETVEFRPLNDSIAPGQVVFEKDKHFIRFIPDTTALDRRVWRAFRDSSGAKNEGVSGVLTVTDRWNTKHTISNLVTPRGEKLFKISWYNASGFTFRKNVPISTIDDDKVTIKLNELITFLGLDYGKMQGCRYEIIEQYEDINSYKKMSAVFVPESTSVEVTLRDNYAAGDRFGIVGTYTVHIQPSETDLSFKPIQIQLRFDLRVTITAN